MAEKPAFGNAYRQRHYLIPADGFDEWASVGRQKQPYLFLRQAGEPYALVGLWEYLMWPR